jgi:hypothetical protein
MTQSPPPNRRATLPTPSPAPGRSAASPTRSRPSPRRAGSSGPIATPARCSSRSRILRDGLRTRRSAPATASAVARTPAGFRSPSRHTSPTASTARSGPPPRGRSAQPHRCPAPAPSPRRSIPIPGSTSGSIRPTGSACPRQKPRPSPRATHSRTCGSGPATPTASSPK